jgi:hypothetical protein
VKLFLYPVNKTKVVLFIVLILVIRLQVLL